MITEHEQHRHISFEGFRISLPIYMDYPASTPLDEQVATAMTTTMRDLLGNPHSSTHRFGHQARQSIERAQEQIASLIGARPYEIIFTSGATEANNLALLGLVRATPDARHIISVETEHEAVLQPLKHLSKNQEVELTLLPVDENGLIDLKALKDAIRPETILVSVMAANNETGVQQDINAIGHLCTQNGIAFHCDAAQALATKEINVTEHNITLLSLSGHKMYGPMGIGALYVKEGTNLAPLFHGGAQQRAIRPGTLPTGLCIGLGEACRIVSENRDNDVRHIAGLRATFKGYLQAELGEGVRFNGEAVPHIPGCISATFTEIDAEDLLHEVPDLALSTGSACSSMRSEPSHVLRAMGLSVEEAAGTIRLGLGRQTSSGEVAYAARQIIKAYRNIRTGVEQGMNIDREER